MNKPDNEQRSFLVKVGWYIYKHDLMNHLMVGGLNGAMVECISSMLKHCLSVCYGGVM